MCPETGFQALLSTAIHLKLEIANKTNIKIDLAFTNTPPYFLILERPSLAKTTTYYDYLSAII
jgi:hypothetical protein